MAEQYFVYGTMLDVKADGVGASESVKNVCDYISSLESVFSPTIQGSDLNKINSSSVGEAVACTSDTMQLMCVSELVFKASNGAYDPSVYPLVRLWNFSGDKFLSGVEREVPTHSEIAKALELVGLDKAFSVDYEKGTITKLIDGAMLDFGGVAKGYATQKSLEKSSAKVLVNLGGNIGASGKTYAVGIANPTRMDRNFSTPYFAKFTLLDGECVSTSGDYERCYQASDGNIYHHIINPQSGYPVDTNEQGAVVSCTVVAKDGALADALATAVVVLGEKEGVALLNEYGVKALLIKSDYSHVVVGNFSIEIKQ